jgi:hypothetical protein
LQLQTGSRRQSGKTTILKHLKKKNHQRRSAKMENYCCQSTIGDLHAAINNTIYESQLQKTSAAAAVRNLDAAIPLRSADTRLQNPIESSRTDTQIAAPKSDGAQAEKNDDFEAFLKGN